MPARTMLVRDIANHNFAYADRAKLLSSCNYPGTLVVPEWHDALQLARRIDAQALELVVVTDEAGAVTGFLVPSWMLGKISAARGRPYASLTEALEDMAADPAEIARGDHAFKHEWFRTDRTNLAYCPGGHYVSRLPCRDHPGTV